MNLETRTERLTNNVVCICETVCNQHEICIQMLEGKEYQTLYKVMKKEQRISRMAEMINHQVMELMPLVQPVPATLRRLLVSSHVSFELLHMRSSARAAAEFADSCEDEELRIYVEELERSLILTLRVVIAVVCAPRFGVAMVWYAVPVGWAVNYLISFFEYRTGRWRRLTAAAVREEETA